MQLRLAGLSSPACPLFSSARRQRGEMRRTGTCCPMRDASSARWDKHILSLLLLSPELWGTLFQECYDAFAEILCLSRATLFFSFDLELLFEGIARARPEETAGGREGKRRTFTKA